MGTKKAVVLAAGKGTRMKSDLPKVLYPVNGKPIIDYVIDRLEEAGMDEIVVVVGYQGERVRNALSTRRTVTFAEQRELLGTGHAVASAKEALEGVEGAVFVIAGDSPMLATESVEKLFDAFDEAQRKGEPLSAVLGTVHKADPTGMGRILRDEKGEFIGIVEEKDATPDQKKITEINMSYYVFNNADLLDALTGLKNNNAQKEYYITDVPAILRAKGKRIVALPVLKPSEALGVNTVEDVQRVEAEIARLGQ